MVDEQIEVVTPPLPEPLSEWTVVLLSRAAEKMRADFEQRVSHLGLRSKHYGVLLLLRGGPLTQAEIGRGVRVDRTSMVALIDELERLGLVERARHAEDRRAHAVTLTGKGREVERQASHAVDATEAACLALLSPGEREHLRDLLSRLI